MKIKKSILNVLLVLFVIAGICFVICNGSFASANQNFDSINPLVEMDDKIYVQHTEPDENGNIYNIYLLKSEGAETTLWEVLNVEFHGFNKYWTTKGDYVDELELYMSGNNYSSKVISTTPDEYLDVIAGEEYFVKMYGEYRIYNKEWIPTVPILFLNDNNEAVGYALDMTMSSSKKGVTFTVPEGATRMHITNYCNQNISIQKKVVVTSEEFNKIKAEQDKILNNLDSNYAQIKEDPIIYKNFDKAYITFVNDDTTPAVDQFADLFISKNTPLCFAAVAGNMSDYASNGNETRLDVALRVQAAGGEILAHNGPVITANTIDDDEFMYNYFVTQKKLLTRMGLNVNGIILAGGSGQIVGDSRSAKWVASLYSYSDLLGEKYATPYGVDSVYFHYRGSLGNYYNDVDKMKAAVDSIVAKKQWQVFYFHNTNEISLANLEALVDYINSIGTDKVEIVTYETMYEKFAVRESVVKNDTNTYYVSANGTSTDGTNINDPINLSTLKTKKLKTGDTVLFKRGDTFFGTLDFEVYDTDNGVLTVSSYGEGDLPTFSTYKYVTGIWEKYSDSIYRIDISNTNNYTGYTSSQNHAYNVGFIEDDSGNKYYEKKVSVDKLENNFDFYSDGSKYLYMYLDSGNPHEVLGNVKAVVRSMLMTVDSNMDIKNIRLSYTGGHAIEGCATNLSNITIENCIIENIGGSYLFSSSLTNDTRYGNGIEFYGSNASDITIKNNIIRNVYDVAFTIQGSSGSGTNVKVHDNVMVNNSQDSEIWESGSATGVVGYKYYNNISINQGRGWGYDARPDQYASAAILFWGYNIDNTDIEFTNNIMYNPRRIYFAAYQGNTNEFFKQEDKIKSDYNTYYLGKDAKLFREEGSISDTSCLNEVYHKDANSTFLQVEVDDNIIQVATTSNKINEIRKTLGIETEPEEENNEDPSELEDSTEEDSTEDSGELQDTQEEGSTEDPGEPQDTQEEENPEEPENPTNTPEDVKPEKPGNSTNTPEDVTPGLPSNPTNTQNKGENGTSSNPANNPNKGNTGTSSNPTNTLDKGNVGVSSNPIDTPEEENIEVPSDSNDTSYVGNNVGTSNLTYTTYKENNAETSSLTEKQNVTTNNVSTNNITDDNMETEAVTSFEVKPQYVWAVIIITLLLVCAIVVYKVL